MADEQPPFEVVPEFASTYSYKNMPYFPVNGVWGGPSPSSEVVVATLLTEQFTLPIAGRTPIQPGGRVEFKDEKYDQRSDIERVPMCTIVLSPESAMSLGRWLMEKATKAMEGRGQHE